jgi:hypothetical protein
MNQVWVADMTYVTTWAGFIAQRAIDEIGLWRRCRMKFNAKLSD